MSELIRKTYLKRKLFLSVVGTALVLLFQNCGGGLESATGIVGSGTNDQCSVASMQKLSGSGSVTLQEAINSQLMAHHHAHATHAGDDDKVSDHAALLSLFPKAEDPKTFVALKGGSWFHPQNWSKNEVPGDNAQVYIPKGISMIYDSVSDKKIDRVAVDGELHFAVDTNTRLYVDTLLTSPRSVFTIGIDGDPVQAGVKAEILIHRNNGPVNTAGDPKLMTKGVISHGKARVFGAKKTTFLKIDPQNHARAGDRSITLTQEPVGWRVGDRLVVGATHNDINYGEVRLWRDESVTIQSIQDIGNGKYRVSLNQALEYDHVPPSHSANVVLSIPVANFTRNVTFATDTGGELYQGNGNTVPVNERGHVMFMHNNDIRIQNAAFVELGRTDKSKFFSDTNVAGRYALHLHRAGADVTKKPALVAGNAIWGSPGWGIVHHDSNMDVVANAVFGVFGSGIVAEAGNETGIWSDNIVIQTTGTVRTFNAEQSADGNGVQPVEHPAYQAEVENNSFSQGEAYGMKSRLITITGNIAVSANGAGFSFWPHGADGPSHIGAHSSGYLDVNGFDPFYGQSSVYPGKVPTRHFFNNEVIASRHALNTSANKIAHRHDMDVVIEDMLVWNVDQPIMSFYQENYLIKDSVFIRGQRNVYPDYGDINFSATHIHDPIDFKMINNYWEGFRTIAIEPIQFVLGNTVVGSPLTEQTGPDGLFREGATADNDSIDIIDNSDNWRNNPKFENPVGFLNARVDLSRSTLFMERYFSRFTIAVEKTDTIGLKFMEMGSTRSKEFRGASQKNWWKQNAANRGYYEHDGDIYLITEAVVSDRISATVGSFKVAIRLDFISDPTKDFPYGAKAMGDLPAELADDQVGEFRIVDKREFGKVGNLLRATPVANLSPGPNPTRPPVVTVPPQPMPTNPSSPAPMPQNPKHNHTPGENDGGSDSHQQPAC